MKVKSKVFYWYAAFVVAYACLTLIPSPDKKTLAHYHLSAASLRLLDLTILIPLIIIWFAAFYGYYKLHAYGRLIKQAKDGRAVMKLSYGLLAMAVGLSASSILSAIFQLISRHYTGFTNAAAIISNYVTVAYLLIAFIFLSIGARSLSTISKSRLPLLTSNILTLIVLALGVAFCALIGRNHQDIETAFHMTATQTMLTLALPSIYAWLLGVSAIAEIYFYTKRVAGVVYRDSWGQLTLGLSGVIIFDILLQYLTALSSWLTGLSLARLLLLLYVLLLLLAGAFIVAALGTKKLVKIEEA